MAQITKCDRCGVVPPTDEPCEQITARGVRADLCQPCVGELLDPWLADVVARVNAVPAVPSRVPNRLRGNPFADSARPAQHGYTAAAIEAAQDPSRDAPS